MPLSSFNIVASTNWAESKTNPGFNSTTQSDGLQFALTGLSVGTWNQAYIDALTITASASHDIDLLDITNFVCENFSFTKVLGVFILPTVADITFGPDGQANCLQWFFDDTDATVTVPAGGIFMWTERAGGSGTTVDSSHHILRITNLSGSVSALVKIVIVGSTL